MFKHGLSCKRNGFIAGLLTDGEMSISSSNDVRQINDEHRSILTLVHTLQSVSNNHRCVTNHAPLIPAIPLCFMLHIDQNRDVFRPSQPNFKFASPQTRKDLSLSCNFYTSFNNAIPRNNNRPMTLYIALLHAPSKTNSTSSSCIAPVGVPSPSPHNKNHSADAEQVQHCNREPPNELIHKQLVLYKHIPVPCSTCIMCHKFDNAIESSKKMASSRVPC